MELKTLTWAEVTAIIICIGFMTFAALQRFLPVGEEAGFVVENAVAEDTEVIGETHFADGKLCLNSATAQELEQLPGIGEALAARIIAYREENGPFTSIEDIMNVPGIKEGTYEKIKDKIAIE